MKSRCRAAPGSAPAWQGEPGAGPGYKWCSAVTDSTQGCSVHHPLTVPWDQPEGVPLPPAGNARPPADPRPPARLACHGRQDSDGLQHLHIFPGRKCQVLRGSVSCRQQAGQDRGHAEERVPISDEQCRGREGESRVPPPSLSASSLSWAPSLLLVTTTQAALGRGNGPVKHPCSSGGAWRRPRHSQGDKPLQLMVPLPRGLQTCPQVGLHHLQATCCS